MACNIGMAEDLLWASYVLRKHFACIISSGVQENV